MRILYASALTLTLATPAYPGAAEVDALWTAMRFDDYAVLLAAEGEDYGDDIARTLFGEEPGKGWQAAVASIYDVGDMRAALSRELHARLDAHEMVEAVAFFESETGAQSIELEISARRALLDPDIEAASVETLGRMQAEGHPRLALIEEFSDANALVENNVASALNTNFAFLSAMADAGQGPFVGDREGILRSVWSQEAEIRAETEEWVLSFFAFAYGPLSDGEMRELIAFSKTGPGKRLNEALFGTFDALFEDLSARLGTAAARYLESDAL